MKGLKRTLYKLVVWVHLLNSFVCCLANVQLCTLHFFQETNGLSEDEDDFTNGRIELMTLPKLKPMDFIWDYIVHMRNQFQTVFFLSFYNSLLLHKKKIFSHSVFFSVWLIGFLLITVVVLFFGFYRYCTISALLFFLFGSVVVGLALILYFFSIDSYRKKYNL